MEYGQRQEAISRLAVEIGTLNSSPWTPHHWFFTIPRIQLAAESQDIVLSVLRAISEAFQAIHSRDETLRCQALQHYARGLTYQRHQLRLLEPGGLEASPDAVLPPLLVAVLLLEFEIMAPQSHHSWIGHASGSTQLLALLTPEACQVTPLFEIFWQLRFSMVAPLTCGLGMPCLCTDM